MLRAVLHAPLPLTADAHAASLASRFWTVHLWLPLGVGLALIAALQAGADQWLADALVRIEGGRWAWRHAPWLELGVHRAGRDASIVAWLALAAASGIAAFRNAGALRWRRATGYVLVCVVLGTLAVSLLKAVTNVDCPWDLARYGGTRPLIGLLDVRPQALPRARCFPAGHASAGYAWLGLYFAALQVAPHRRRAALTLALGAGLLFGVGQQLRGAHFASHDAATALVCWLVALGLWRAWPWSHASRAGGAAR